MKKSRKGIIIVFVIGMSIFGYSQYALASQIGVVVIESDLIKKTDKGSSYNVELEFENPSLLILTAGDTDFFVIANGKTVGEGKLEPFTLPALGNSSVSGTFQTESNEKSQEVPVVMISGITKYDVLFSTIDVPFVFYPTEEQAKEFIHQD
jgi:beta-xylosidase